MRQAGKDLLLAAIITWLLPGFVLGLLQFINSPDAQPQETVPTDPPVADMEIRVILSEGVQDMELSEYLTGVLLCEMPESFPMEAQKAQAVVARTYALRTVTTKDKHPDKAICTDPACCQGYTAPSEYAGSARGIAQARQAVLDTDGQVLLYGGELIDATYFSCSGGQTEAAVAVWGTDVPYLQSVASPGEEGAAHYESAKHFTAAEFAAALSVQLQGSPDSWIRRITYTQGGGVANVTIGDRSYTGTQIRSLLGLKSTCLSMQAENGGITVYTKGFGHRVGMSQYGAQAMAQAGNDYRQILLHYYAGVYLAEYCP